MLKGAQKQMIVVRTRDSRLFEEAYFVMRRDTESKGIPTADMVGEANRIIEGAWPKGKRDGRKGQKALSRFLVWVAVAVAFGMGIAVGGGTVGLLWLLL